MPEPITMFIAFAIGAAAGGAVVHFWEQIETWAEKAFKSILSSIDLAKYNLRQSAYYLVKDGSKYITKILLETIDKNGEVRYFEKEHKEVQKDDLPANVIQALQGSKSVVLMTSKK